jgi:restriction endonuclease S subunit
VSAWPTIRLGDVCEKITDGTHHSPSNGPTGDFMYVTAKNIKPWGLDLSDITYIDAQTHREIYSRCDVRTNDVLYVKDGATTGRVALNTLTEQFSLLSSVGVLRPGSGIKPKYLLYALQVPSVLDRMLDDMAGVAITRLTIKKLKDAAIPLAPFALQDEIVAEIEKQFSRLDEGVANLQRVKANLKRYKASVLKAAVEGRLVPTKGNWVKAKLGDIALSVRNGYSKKPDAEFGNRIFRISAVRPMELNAGDVRYLSGRPTDYEPFYATVGDVLFTRYNGSRDYVGVCAEVPQGLPPTIYPDKLIRVRVPKSILLPGFLVIAASTGLGRASLEAMIRTTAGQSGVSGSDIKAIPLEIPTIQEQQRILTEVDSRLSTVRVVANEVDADLKRAQGLRQATLQKLFTTET